MSDRLMVPARLAVGLVLLLAGDALGIGSGALFPESAFAFLGVVSGLVLCERRQKAIARRRASSPTTRVRSW
jgi:hypothetical protein